MTFIDTILDRLAAGLNTIRSAAAVARAVEARRAPKAIDLRTLGIDPRAFASIGHG